MAWPCPLSLRMCPVLDGQPVAVFQPFIDTATGQIAGVEALARLRDAHGHLHSAGPLFADPKTPAAALRKLDRAVREQAFARFHAAPPDWFLSVNISPRWIGPVSYTHLTLPTILLV